MRWILQVTRKESMMSNMIFGFFACKIYQQQRAVLCGSNDWNSSNFALIWLH